jgi:hypothetical protein
MTGAEEIIGYKGANHWVVRKRVTAFPVSKREGGKPRLRKKNILQSFIQNISHKYIRPLVQRPKVKTFRHQALVATHEEIQLE